MRFLIALVVLLAALGVLNLLLTFGLVRRLREHTKLLNTLYEFVGVEAGIDPERAGIVPGETVGEFQTTTVDGEPVGRDDLAPATVVAFLAATCDSCHEQLPDLLTYARERGRQRVLAVVDGAGGDPTDLVERLNAAVRVVLADPESSIGSAFRIRSFPRFFVLGADGTLAAVARTVSRLPADISA